MHLGACQREYSFPSFVLMYTKNLHRRACYSEFLCVAISRMSSVVTRLHSVLAEWPVLEDWCCDYQFLYLGRALLQVFSVGRPGSRPEH